MDELSGVKVHGLAQLKMVMDGLPQRLQRKAAIKALRAGGKVFRDEARNEAPVHTGKLRRNIYYRKAKDSRPDLPLVSVRVRRKGKKGDPNNAFYWVFVEFGTSKMPANPFMRRAFDAAKLQATRAVADSLRDQLSTVVRESL